MKKIKNQNIFHVTINNKKTLCGLSNQWNDADTLQKFENRLLNKSYIKFCCIKCQIKLN